MASYMGIDIGSETSKGVIITGGQPVAYRRLTSGVNYGATAEKLRNELLQEAGLPPEAIDDIVATGQGAGNVAFSQRQATDTRCCARGINSIFPSARTVIDIQAQSSQIIQLNENGRVINFVASEKCAAGSGRFLTVIANVLRIKIEDIGPLSLQSRHPITFTTGCAVFGESEAISRVAEGVAVADILAGVHQALANKIASLSKRVAIEADCAISGGGGWDQGLISAIEKTLGVKLLIPPHPQFVTALGAAIIASEKPDKADGSESSNRTNQTRESLGGEL